MRTIVTLCPSHFAWNIYIFYLTFLTSNLFNYNKLQTKLNMQQLQHKKQTNNQNKTTTNTIHHTNSNENCHPFKYGKYTFMHNGGIPSFSKIKRQVLNLLSERVYQDIKGSTDSKHLFAIFLDYVSQKKGQTRRFFNSMKLTTRIRYDHTSLQHTQSH